MKYKKEVQKIYPNSILKIITMPIRSGTMTDWIYNTDEPNKKPLGNHWIFYLIVFSHLHRNGDFIASSEIGSKQAWKRAWESIQTKVINELSNDQ